MEHYHHEVEIKPRIEVDVDKLCFICLNETSPNQRHYSKGFQSKVNLLTSYILQGPSPSSSSSTQEDRVRNELQRNILSCLSDGKSSICSNCLLKAEELVKLHLELEKIQMQILDVLRNLQDHLKCSQGDGIRMEELEELSRFQNCLVEEFMRRKLSDGTEVRIQRLHAAEYDRFLVLPETLEQEHEFAEEIDIGNYEDGGMCDGNNDNLSDGGSSSDNAQVKCPSSGRKGKAKASRSRSRNHWKCSRASKFHYECDICLEDLPHKDMEDHLRTHAQFEKYYKCDICPDNDRNRIFGSYKGLVWHYLRFPHNVQLPCNLCPDQDQCTLFARRELCKHLYDFHQLNHGKLPCGFDYCPEEFCDPISRNKHRSEKHIAKPREIFTCELCQITFKTRNALQWHMRRRHEKEQVFSFRRNLQEGHALDIVECSQCSKNVLNAYLEDHIEAMHKPVDVDEQGRGKFICDICNKTLKLKSTLDTHIERIHTEGKVQLFQCDECPKEFKSQVTLHAHKKKRHGEMDVVVCPHCPKTFNSYTLSTHVKRVHGDKTFQCGFCPKTFTSRDTLKMHEEAHRGERKYKCEECPFSANTAQSLRKHQLTHKEKTLKCQYCPKMYASKKNLKIHERNHTKERPYKCAVCPRTFIHAHTRSYHQRRTHGMPVNTTYQPLARVGTAQEEAEKADG